MIRIARTTSQMPILRRPWFDSEIWYMNRLWWVNVAFANGLLVASVGCHRPAESAPPAGQTKAAVDRVTAGKPVRKTLKLVTTQPGRIEAFEEAPLFPKLAGYVQEVLVDIG